MARRSVASATISFGLVSIPVKFYLAASPESVHFCLLDPKTKKRVHQQYVNTSGDLIERGEMARGYEVGKNNIVVFTTDEIKSLEEKNSGSLEITEFVAASDIDLLHVEKSYQIAPDKGGDKPYKLLAVALTKSNKYAVGQWTARGKQHLVVIRPYKDGLVLHQMFYANEVRDYESNCAVVPVRDVEVDMACKLIDSLSSTKYDASKYKDGYIERVSQAVKAKIAGVEIPNAKEPMNPKVDDLFAALKASLEASTKK